MIKKTLILITFILIGTLFVYSNTSFAKNDEASNADLLENEFDQLIDQGILPKELTIEEFAEMNDESLFDDLKVPDRIITSGGQENISFLSGVFSLKKGDILVSNGTSSAGLTGHAGIALNSTQILHIANSKSKPAVISAKDWVKSYGLVKGQVDGITRTKVYRVNNNSATKAGTWASNNYVGKPYKYGFTGAITSKDPTYCSKIVWQAYNSQKKAKKPSTIIISPYQLPTHITGATGLGIM